MKKLFLSYCTIIALMVTFVGCKGTANSNDPKAVAKAFIDALSANDWDGAAKYGTADTKQFLESMKSMMSMAEKFGGKKEEAAIDKEWKGKKVEYTDAKIEGENATVILKADGKEVMPISLKKEAGAWKVAFDKATLMNQGLNKMKEKNSEGVDQTEDAIKSLNGMGDSIKNAMKQATDAIDSANKMLKEQ